LYKNVSDDGRNPEVLSLPGCTRSCPLDKFFQLVQNVTSDDIKVECKLVKPDVSTFDTMLGESLVNKFMTFRPEIKPRCFCLF
jgi:lysosomal acid phosphatase